MRADTKREMAEAKHRAFLRRLKVLRLQLYGQEKISVWSAQYREELVFAILSGAK